MHKLRIVDSSTRQELESFEYDDYHTNGVVKTYKWHMSDKEIADIKVKNVLVGITITANPEKNYVSVDKHYSYGDGSSLYETLSYHYNKADIRVELE